MFFPAGTTVLLGLHAAGLGQPDDGFRFDIDRDDRAPHLAFGLGAHHCLGAALARAELQEALNAFLDVVPAYRLAAPVTWKPLSMGIWGPEKLEFEILESQSGVLNDQIGRSFENELAPLTATAAPDSENLWIQDARGSKRNRCWSPSFSQRTVIPASYTTCAYHASFWVGSCQLEDIRPTARSAVAN